MLFGVEDRQADHSAALIGPAGQVITYHDLAAQIAETATILGAERRLLVIEAHRNLETLIAYLGALSAGHAVAMLAPDDMRALSGFIRDFAPDGVFDGQGWELQPITAGPKLHPDLALLLSTSGSTGDSKFVRLSRENLVANARAIADYLQLTPQDRSAHILPLQYCYGLSVLHSHLIAGASVYLAPSSVISDDFLPAIEVQGCTNLSGVPHTYRLLEESDFRARQTRPLRFMTVAGGKMPPDLATIYHTHLNKRQGELFLMYGQTEATARIAYLPPSELTAHMDTIGRAIPGGELSLLDEQGQPFNDTGKPGELIYRGPNVMMGYASALEDLSHGPEIDWLHTGDLAERTADGFFRIVGRLKRMSKISGNRISHDAIEQALSRDGIDALVTGDDKSLLILHATTWSTDYILSRTAQLSGLPKMVLRVDFVPALPRLPTGKPDYPAARQRLEDLRAIEEQDAQSADIRAIFRETFPGARIDDTDSFVSLGGDSLSHVQMSLRLEQVFGGLPRKWETLTVAELSDRNSPRPIRSEIGSDILIRISAIVLVVIHHATLWPIPGGAAAMLIMAGFSLGRFQATSALKPGQPWKLLTGLPKVLLPYAIILIGYGLAWGDFPWASALLMGNFGFADPVNHDMMPYLYWFVEIYAQLILIMFGLILIPPVRRFALDRPFAFSLSLIAAGVAMRFGWAQNWDFGNRQIFTVPWNFFLFALGWAASTARGLNQRLAIFALACVLLPLGAYYGGNWIGGWIKFMLQFPVMALLLFVPTVAMSKRLIAPLLTFASSTYHIYLFHRIVPEHFPEWLGSTWSQPFFVTVSIVFGIACGIAAYVAQNALLRWVSRRVMPELDGLMFRLRLRKSTEAAE